MCGRLGELVKTWLEMFWKIENEGINCSKKEVANLIGKHFEP